MMMPERNRCVCFTGHRPEKLTRSEQTLRTDLEKEILHAVADGFDAFITGMAKGIDLWAADTVRTLRDAGLPIKLFCACPYSGCEKSMSKEWKRLCIDILAAADGVIHVSPGYHPGCFQIRNRWMVDHTARVISVYNGEKGGTKNTIDYAQKNGVPVVFIDG